MQFASLTESSWRNKMWKLWIFSVLFAPVVFAKPEVCFLPVDVGPCRGINPRFNFNAFTGRCERFTYGGCRGNANNFKTLQQCRNRCSSSRRICFLPVDMGPCRGIYPRIYFNAGTGRCERFTYGGCQGNANNFQTFQQCRNRCSSSRRVCLLPAESGPCFAYFRRFYYDAKTGKCKRFVYGGCKGNKNNFETLRSCQARCRPRRMQVCLLPSLKGPCRARFQRYFFNSQTGTCETFIYGGCRGNANNFRSEQECQETCTSELDCYLPPVRGLCKASMPSYFWNSTSNTCEKFIYGGCGGNANRFSSLNDCEAKCDPVCELPPVRGFCKAYMPSYFWNSTSNTCEQFIYGGCGGNANRFSSVKDCEDRCNPVCDLPPVQGYCRAYIPSFFWNSTSNACEQFIYGGCGGNDNRFSSINDCKVKCDKVCDLPPVTGLCEAYIPSYFWNSTSNTCEQFIYGGCGGNANRFSSVKDCTARCDPVCNLPPLTGTCKASFQRYFWNSTSNACETFIYGGCKGNSNRFSSKEDCETMCDSVCDIPIAPGTCGSNIASYGWNKEIGKCQYFTYGGCGGNDNRFTTKHDCLEMCGPPRVCKLSVDSGDCEGEFIKYYFNPTSGYCEKFTYGGCNGNQNNFDTEQQCMDHCKPTHSVCSLDYDGGRCFGQIPSFYYNRKAKECQRFFYGGCGGNGNRFESYDTCMDKCSPLRKSVYDNL